MCLKFKFCSKWQYISSNSLFLLQDTFLWSWMVLPCLIFLWFLRAVSDPYLRWHTVHCIGDILPYVPSLNHQIYVDFSCFPSPSTIGNAPGHSLPPAVPQLVLPTAPPFCSAHQKGPNRADSRFIPLETTKDRLMFLHRAIDTLECRSPEILLLTAVKGDGRTVVSEYNHTKPASLMREMLLRVLFWMEVTHLVNSPINAINNISLNYALRLQQQYFSAR